MWNCFKNLKIPEKLGAKIVSARGFLRVLVPLATQTVDVEEFDKKFNTPIAIGKFTLKFTQLDIKGNSVNFQIAVTGGEKADSEGTQIPIAVNLTDAKNNSVLSCSITGGGLGGSWGGGVTKPLKLHLSCPTRTKEVVIPFELKDLPLPSE